MDEILSEFIVESTEALDALDVELIELEQDPESTPTLSSIFRRIHTIKGTCGFLGFSKLEKVTHVGENLLSKLRDGELTVTPDMTSELLSLTDAVREMIDAIASTGEEGTGEYGVLEARLKSLAETGTLDGAPALEAPAAPAPEAAPATEEAPAPEETPAPEAAPEAELAPEAPTAVEASEEPVAEDEEALEPEPADAHIEEPAAQVVAKVPSDSWPESAKVGDLLIAKGKATKQDLANALSAQSAGDPRHVGEILIDHGVITQQDIVEVLNQQGSAASVADSSIRVDVELLDSLMNLVGELVLNRNQVMQFTKDVDDAQLTATLQRLDLITTELQGSVMKTRMQPIENAWAKYPRIVRDLARQTGKQVNLETFGNETELDKTLLEAIKDPLTHIVRNAIDHGIETPEARTARGKNPTGTLTLRAFHESGQVIIEISDDGGGIDPQRVKDKAIANGVITPERAARLSKREAIELVFAAGFSMAEQVSNISGRGVGMDVVRTNIEQIGGTVDLQSDLGAGTTLRVKIPLTLAIIPALVVTSGEDHYAIPQVSLLELVRLNDPEAPGGIEYVHGAPVHRLRGELLPLVFLADVLGDERGERGAMSIVVLQAGERNFGLVVDAIEDTAEIVVKPLGRLLKHLSIFAGATIMGDGHVALILDVVGLAGEAGLLTDTDRRGKLDAEEESAEASQSQTLLLFSLSTERCYALPLSSVARLEEFKPEQIEHSGDTVVVQYRGDILPLIDVAGILERGRGSGMDADLMQVVVYSDAGRTVGLVVGGISDIVEQRLDVTRDVDLPGISGSAVVQGRVTDVVDVDALLMISGLATSR